MAAEGIKAEVIDLRIVNPFKPEEIIRSVQKTGNLVVVDGGWRTCGMAGEVIASVTESVEPGTLKSRPRRVTLPDAPAPTSRPLEQAYYTQPEEVAEVVRDALKGCRV